MFETAELGNKIDKEHYNEQEPLLRAELLQVQKELAAADLSVLVLVRGVEGAGKTDVVNLLLEWMDPRGIETHALGKPTAEERQHPPMWRFWMALPPKGRMGIFHGAWYPRMLLSEKQRERNRALIDQRLDRVVDFETMLTNEGTLLVKFWLHLSRPALKERLERLSASRRQRWRVTREDRRWLKNYDQLRSVSEYFLRRTGTGVAPWHIIEATDSRYRNLTVARILLQAMRTHLENLENQPKPVRQPDVSKPAPVNIINQLNLSKAVSKDDYDAQLSTLQGKVNRLTRTLHDRGRSMIALFEGPDAAGKGGSIRRLIQCMDARDYQVTSVAAPTDEERAHPYLWRFWRHLPARGRISIYDRSWYGRVLVERVEGFCAPTDWQRAYKEITAFEDDLTEFGIILLKFWLAISPEEQLLRFKDRQTTPYKQYKITEEDWRNRAKWDAYEAAACDMIEKTSTEPSPWTLVEANNKEWARLKVLRTVAQRLQRELKS